jgi:hypothetical protein
LTQPTTCNLCNKRNITSAYHTVCDPCSASHPKAIALLEEWNSVTSSAFVPNSNTPCMITDAIHTSEEIHTNVDDIVDASNSNDHELASASTPPQKQIVETQTIRHQRVCTVCFKQPALPNDDDQGMDSAIAIGSRPMKLRQVKSLQRQKEKQSQQQHTKKKNENVHADGTNMIQHDCDGVTEEEDNIEYNDDDIKNHDDEDDNEAEYEDDDDDDDDIEDDDMVQGQKSQSECFNICDHSERKLYQCDATNPRWNIPLDDNNDDVNDPFLQAIGGAKNLRIGEAYQTMLLEKNSKSR